MAWSSNKKLLIMINTGNNFFSHKNTKQWFYWDTTWHWAYQHRHNDITGQAQILDFAIWPPRWTVMFVAENLFSSPEPKLKLTFLITICPLSVCLSVCKFFTFSISFPAPLGIFQTNMTQNTLRQNEFKFVKSKDHAFF